MGAVTLKGLSVYTVMTFMPHNKRIIQLTCEIRDLKKEMCRISMVDEFAKYARMQRKVNKLQEERKSLAGISNARKSDIKNIILLCTRATVTVTLSILFWFNKGEAVAVVPGELLWPASKIFSWFSDIPGLVSVPSWILMSSTASRILAKGV